MLINLSLVALGGALGASLRYGVGLLAQRLGAGFPFGTVSVNLLGSFLMGVCFVLSAKLDHPRFAPLMMTGLLGGFTTFSAFSLDAVSLFERGDALLAGLYVALSVGLSIAALLLGAALTRGVLA